MKPVDRIMRMVHRPMQPADLPECMALLPAHVPADAADRAAIAAQWPRLMEQAALLAGVMEDLSLPAGQRVLGWGVSLMLSPAQAQALALSGRPHAHLARRVYAGLRSGALVTMDDREIGRCNAAGSLVNLVLHFTMPSLDLADPQVHKVVACAQESFRVHHLGWNWQALYLENSQAMSEVHRESGYDLLAFADEDALAPLPAPLRPAFMGLTREQARMRLPGTTIRNCFESEPPRFRFSAQQRRLLWLSLFDDADTALMPALGVSVHGLKKLWKGVYERIEDVAPDFFGGDVGGDDDGKRGPEKRRQVLAYVRQRLEELRPWASG
jgi:hypothetical protein